MYYVLEAVINEHTHIRYVYIVLAYVPAQYAWQLGKYQEYLCACVTPWYITYLKNPVCFEDRHRPIVMHVYGMSGAFDITHWLHMSNSVQSF